MPDVKLKPSAPMKPFWAMLAVLVGVSAIVVASRLWTPREIIPWRDDYQAGLAEAARLHKPVFLDFTAEWCSPCQELRHTIWADKDVEKALQAFVPVRVDVDKYPDISRQYEVETIPHFAILSSDGKLIATGGDEREPETIIPWLSRASALPK